MRLDRLVAALPGAQVLGPVDREIRAVQVDSRKVGPGDLFLAYPGVTLDLHQFIPRAIEQGAVAVVAERQVAVPDGVTLIKVESGRAAWALLSAASHEFPSRAMTVIGVTGTDGKTSTSSLIHAVLTGARRRVGLITTVAAQIGGESLDTGFHTTTPEPPEIQRYLAEMRRRDIECAVIETTSHALALDKVLGIDYDIAVVTNVTHEHLDFHGTWQAYLEAKAKLFDGLASSRRKDGQQKVAVLNRDDVSFERLSLAPVDRRITYALDSPADVTAEEIVLASTGTRFVARTPIGDLPIEARLLGRFNVANSLAAIATGITLGATASEIVDGLSTFGGVAGRLELVDQGQPFGVVVDFAHTPNSLHRVLELGRSLSSGKVSVVFGCAGLRDVAKRPLMGQVAGELANRVYLTAEDPRTESLDEIISQIAVGVHEVGASPIVIPDRGDAIRSAIAGARAGDIVMITGKGHERTMCFGEEERPWDDRIAVRQVLDQLGYLP